MRKVFFLLLLALIASFMVGCDNPIMSVVRKDDANVTITTRNGNSSTHQVLLPVGAVPSPSASPDALVVSNLRFETTMNSITARFDGSGVEKISVYLNGDKRAEGLVGSERSYTFSGLDSNRTYKVRVEFFGKNSQKAELAGEAITLTSGASPSPSPSAGNGTPVLYDPVYSRTARSLTARIGGSNVSELRLRISGQDLLASVDQDLTITGLQPNTSYTAEYWARNSSGSSTSKSFSFTTLSEGGGDKTQANFWQVKNENFTSLVNWAEREWTEDSASTAGLKVPLNSAQSYTVRITASNGQVQEAAFSNSFVEFRPLPSNLAPYTFEVRVGSTVILSGRIERK